MSRAIPAAVKRLVTRVLLILVLVFCVWGQGDFSWWLRRFKNGTM